MQIDQIGYFQQWCMPWFVLNWCIESTGKYKVILHKAACKRLDLQIHLDMMFWFEFDGDLSISIAQ